MKNKLMPFLVFVLSGLVFSCTSAPQDSGSSPLSAKTLKLVQTAVFEVVLEKPVDDPVVYERELNWDNVPYAIRSDKYYSIGTAFAISNTELITAFHVINLGFESRSQNKYFIRDSEQNIFEVDQISGGSNEKDYLVFTVKGKTFSEFFQFDEKFKVGDPVYSIGNALGEGIVIRNGLVLGTIPEEDSGRWNLLKSSADGNPGNSGGPLVTTDGKVVALVTGLKDNILYSVPAEVINNDIRTDLSYRIKFTFGHLILANKFNRTFELQVPLPDTYAGVRRVIRDAYEKDYDVSMSTLFKEAPEYLTGPNNIYVLNSSLSSIFPEISFVDPNDDHWTLSSLERKNVALDDGGRLMYASVSGYNFYKIKKPSSVSLEKISSDPKFIFDLILQNLRTDRTLWGSDKYRILSFGEPSSTGVYRDELGRTWNTAHWYIDFDDKVLIMYILPLPNGPVIVSTMQPSALRFDYEWDIRKISEHIFAGYDGTFTEWNEFLSVNKYTPDFLKDLRFEWNPGNQSLFLNAGFLSLSADRRVFDWDKDSEMFLAPSWYKQNNKPVFGIRKYILSRDVRGNDFFVVYRNMKPDAKLGATAMENWNDLVIEKYPFDGKPGISVKDNTGSVGAILQARQPDAEVRYSLYLSMENPLNEENLNQRFNAVRQGMSISH